jgi:bacteriorhodopsin
MFHYQAAGYEAAEDGEAVPQYRRLQYYDENIRLGCPPGTEDTKDWSMHKQTVLWVGFSFLFVPALLFLWRSFDNVKDGKIAKGSEVTNIRLNAGMVNMVASLAYLAMATKHGFTTRCNGRDFYYARYVDWIITTPLMLYDLAVVGGSDFNTRLFLCAIDIVMIVSGLIGSLVEDSSNGGDKWAFFGFSMLCFIPVIYLLCCLAGDGKPLQFGNIWANFCTSKRSGMGPRERAYNRAMNITVVSWIVYPIIWILAEGTGTISVEGENIAYTVLDIISKSIFGWVLVFQNWHIAAGAAAAVSASSVL